MLLLLYFAFRICLVKYIIAHVKILGMSLSAPVSFPLCQRQIEQDLIIYILLSPRLDKATREPSVFNESEFAIHGFHRRPAARRYAQHGFSFFRGVGFAFLD